MFILYSAYCIYRIYITCAHVLCVICMYYTFIRVIFYSSECIYYTVYIILYMMYIYIIYIDFIYYSQYILPILTLVYFPFSPTVPKP